MRYCKYLATESDSKIPRYAFVEERNEILWAIAPMPPPEEDLAAQLAPPALTAFHPRPLSTLALLPPVTPSRSRCSS